MPQEERDAAAANDASKAAQERAALDAAVGARRLVLRRTRHGDVGQGDYEGGPLRLDGRALERLGHLHVLLVLLVLLVHLLVHLLVAGGSGGAAAAAARKVVAAALQLQKVVVDRDLQVAARVHQLHAHNNMHMDSM